MIRIHTLNGSPRKKGNTSTLISKLIEQVDSNKIDIQTTYLYDMEICPCIDCRECKKGDLVCILDDDMKKLYPKIETADILLVGTPIYWFGPTAVTKLFVDRLRPQYGNKRLNGKQAALILPAGSGTGDCDLTIEMFKRTFEALGIEYLGAVTSQSFDIGDAEKDEQARVAVKGLAEKIGRQD